MAWLKKIKGSGNWYVAWREGGREQLRTTKTSDRRLAEKVKRAVETRLVLGEALDAPRGGPLLTGAIADYLARAAETTKPKTVTRYGLTLRQFAASLPPGELAGLALRDVTPARVEAFFSGARQRGLADSTIAIDARGLRAFFNYCIRAGWLALGTNPVQRIPRVRIQAERVQFLTVEQLQHLLAGEPRAERRELFRFLVLTGARAAETCALTWGDLRHGLIYFRAGTTKRGQRGEIEIYGALGSLVAEMRQRRGGASACEPATRLWGFSPWWASRCFKAAVIRAGLPGDLHLHCLRHTAAAHLLMAGVSLYDVSKILRHSSTAVTERHYGHLARGHLAGKLELTALAQFGKCG